MTTIVFGEKTANIPREFRIGIYLFRLHDARSEVREIDNGEVKTERKVILHPTALAVSDGKGRELGKIEVAADGTFRTKNGNRSLADGLTPDTVRALLEAF